jgi:hypothetical protein
MAEKVHKQRRLNIYFRQTAKAFRAARQTQVFYHINKNLPYRIYKFSKEKILSQVQKANSNLMQQRENFLTRLQRDKTPGKK